jgi:GntR family transcriptional regulator, transcriptional repressor for pyruvate dehydrogenase complex
MSHDLLSLSPGTFLGVEADVRERYQISRPTLRQAARVLEHQQLLIVKAGAHGGYFVSRPSGSDLVSAAVLYLQSRDFKLADNIIASLAIAQRVAVSAAKSDNEVARQALREMRDRYAAQDFASLPVARLHEAEIELSKAVTDLCGNAAFELFHRIVWEFGAEDVRNKMFDGKPGRIRRLRDLHLALVDAIIAQDVEIAGVLSARGGDQMIAWLEEDAKAQVVLAEEGDAKAQVAPAANETPLRPERTNAQDRKRQKSR